MTEGNTPSPREQLRTRLLEMREQLIDRLAEQITGGDLVLLANVEGALAALDHDHRPAAPKQN